MEFGTYHDFIQRFEDGYNRCLQEIFHYGDETVEMFRPSEEEVKQLKKTIKEWDITPEQRTIYKIFIRGMYSHIPFSYEEWDEDDTDY